MRAAGLAGEGPRVLTMAGEPGESGALVGRGPRMAEHSVVIAGAGPTGLVLAGELALAGVDVLVVERRASQQVDGTRAGGLHSRTLEMLDQRGIVDRFLAAGRTMQIT